MGFREMKKFRLVGPRMIWEKRFSICTMVNDWSRYRQLQAAWYKMGFGTGDCEFLACDNVKNNQLDAYEATRLFLESARGEYVILTHLDSRPMEVKKTVLGILRELNALDPRWAVVGNAGVEQDSLEFVTLGLRMPDYPQKKHYARFRKVDALDENLLIVKSEARLTVSHDLQGFHLYGLDLCDVARRLGRTCYVARMRWYHSSHGTLNENFYRRVLEMERKLTAYRQPKLWGTNCTFLSVSRSPLVRAWARARACWLLRKNEHHSESERREVWRTGRGEPLLFPAYALLWLYKKTGLEKWRKRRLAQRNPLPPAHA